MDRTWIDELKTAAAAETGPLVATLATVRESTSGAVPEARSVIIRHIADDGILTFTSDARSEKAGQLTDEPCVAVVFWLAVSRSQFRVTGRALLMPAQSPGRAEAWKKMSDTARATFAWPPPGLPREQGDSFPKTLGSEVEPPANFDVWTVDPEAVDTLDLRPHPHLRTNWNRQGPAWSAVVVNP